MQPRVVSPLRARPLRLSPEGHGGRPPARRPRALARTSWPSLRPPMHRPQEPRHPPGAPVLSGASQLTESED